MGELEKLNKDIRTWWKNTHVQAYVCVCELLVNLGLWGHIFLVDAKVGTSVWVLTEKDGMLRYEI